MNLFKAVVRYLLIALAIGIIVYLVTITALLWLSFHDQPVVQAPRVDAITKAIDYTRPRPVKLNVVVKRKAVKPDYSDAAKWYYDLESDSYKKRTLK